jgi:hypothetical protein
LITSSRNAVCREATSSSSPSVGPTQPETHAAAADVKVAPWQEGQQKLDGALEASVDFHGDDPKKVADVLHSTGAKAVRTK